MLILWCFVRVCLLVPPMGIFEIPQPNMPTYITHVYRWSYEVCQLVSPIILMPTCITHMYRWSYEVCQLTSPRDIFELPQPSMPTYITHYPFVIEILKYVDIHHLWEQLDHFLSMPTCITHVCSCLYEVCDRFDIYHLNRDTIVLLLAPVGSQYNEDVSHSHIFLDDWYMLRYNWDQVQERYGWHMLANIFLGFLTWYLWYKIMRQV